MRRFPLTPRSLIAIPVVVLATTWFGFWAIVFSVIAPRSSLMDVCARSWAGVLAAACGIRLSAFGAQNIPLDGSAILVSNHQSHLDTVVLFLTCPAPLRMLAKASLFKIPFLGWSMARIGHIPVRRRKPDPQGEQKINQALEQMIARSFSLVVFAEGRRSDSGKLQAFKKGAFHLAKRYDLNIIPVAIDGTTNLLPARSLNFHGGPVTISYLAPISPVGREPEELLDQTRAAIAASLTKSRRSA